MLAAGISPLSGGPALDLSSIVADIASLQPAGFLWLGLLAVIATPITRVIAAAIAFARAGETRMVGVAVAILGGHRHQRRDGARDGQSSVGRRRSLPAGVPAAHAILGHLARPRAIASRPHAGARRMTTETTAETQGTMAPAAHHAPTPGAWTTSSAISRATSSR